MFGPGASRVRWVAMSLGTPELVILLVIVLLIFGGSQLPKLARSLGQAKSEFEKSSDGKSSDTDDV